MPFWSPVNYMFMEGVCIPEFMYKGSQSKFFLKMYELSKSVN